MKTSLVLALGAVASVQGFAPAQQQKVGTQLDATLSERIFGMDLFEPVKDQNNYGARNKKNVSFTTLSMMVQLLAHPFMPTQ